MKQKTKYLVSKSLVFLVIMAGLQNIGKAQDIEILKRPQAFTDFMSNDDAESYYGLSLSQETNLEDLPSSGKPWNIWCVEENAPLFATTNAQRVRSNLRFKEKLQITKTEIKALGNGRFEHWLQVVRGEVNPTQIAGWVRASSVILSPWALKTSGKVGRKALVVPGLNANSNLNTGLPEMQIYNHYRLRTSDAIIGNLAKKFRILYILRESDSAFLLASAETLEGGNSKSSIKGWMPKNKVSEWERRLAYGPAYGTSPNRLFTDKNIPLFKTQSDCQEYLASCDKSASTISLKIEPEERIPMVPAFPFIGESTTDPSDPIRQILNITGFSMNVNSDDLRIKRELEKLQNQLSKVHVYFIVDATASMSKYYPAIAKAIAKLYAQFRDLNSDEGTTLEVGFSVYRDYLDYPRDAVAGSRQAYDETLAGIISGVKCESKNPRDSEAVYNGILKNLTDFNVDPKASNIVILIGDEGNHEIDPKGKTAQMVEKKLLDLNASLFVFQATHFMTQSSNRFQKDALEWVHAIGEKVKSEILTLEEGVIGTSQVDSDKSALDDFRIAKMIFPNKGTGIPASADEMARLIIKDVRDWITQVQERIGEIDTYADAPIFETPQQRENWIQSMIEMGFTRQEAEDYIAQGGDTAVPLYCSLERCQGPHAIDVMVPYVFLSQIDFNTISNSLNDLEYAQGATAKKEALDALCKNLIRTQLGSASELDRYLREGKTMNEIWLEFFQVEFNIPELRDKPLAQIRATPPEDFNTAYEALLRAKEKWQLIDIQERQWEIASTRNQKFYWVEANFFPGFKN